MASNGFQFRGECASNVVVVLEMHSKAAPWSDIPHGSPSLSWHYNMMEQVRTSNFMAVLPLIQVVLVFIPKLSTATWESNIRRSHTAGQGAQSIWGEWCTKYAKDRSRPWHHLQDGTIFSKHPCFSTRSMILCCAYLVPMLIMRRGNSYSTWCYSKLICFGFARVVDVF
jgi:hypothetical protein